MGSYALIGEAIRGQKPRSCFCRLRGSNRRCRGCRTRQQAAGATGVAGRSALDTARRRHGDRCRRGSHRGRVAPARQHRHPAGRCDDQHGRIADSAEVAPSYTVPTNVDASAGSAFIPAARLTNYVVAHSEYSSPLGRRTVLSGVLSDDDDDNDSIDQNDEIEVSVPGAAGPQR